MDEMLDRIADRTAKKITKNVMRKISKIVYKAALESFKEGWLANEGVSEKNFCRDVCKMWETPFRCRDCEK